MQPNNLRLFNTLYYLTFSSITKFIIGKTFPISLYFTVTILKYQRWHIKSNTLSVQWKDLKFTKAFLIFFSLKVFVSIFTFSILLEYTFTYTFTSDNHRNITNVNLFGSFESRDLIHLKWIKQHPSHLHNSTKRFVMIYFVVFTVCIFLLLSNTEHIYMF